MDMKVLGKYLEHCKATGQKDSWEGLKEYERREKDGSLHGGNC